jgi:phosphoribosylamine--glycine ligase
MKVLIVGSGGREHALAWRAAQSSLVETVLVAPGNAGTHREPKVENVPIKADAVDELVRFARRQAVDLTIVGPEQPLVAGITDKFEAAGLKCFGPNARAARLEGSKAFAKGFLERHDIPTAAYARFDSPGPALSYVREKQVPIVIKADGLTAGKGVVVARSIDEAEAALVTMLERRSFGEAGATVIVEEYLEGEEASFIAIVDGTAIVPLASSQDHKARDDGDLGPNTGGMGAYSPAPVVTPKVYDRIMDEVMLPTVQGLQADGVAYRGFLYAGLMIDSAGKPKVLEFNCRFGDPETQPILMRLRSDLVELCLASCDGDLAGANVDWDPRAALGVVMASRGYPGDYAKGTAIHGLEQRCDDHVKIFHAGTRLEDGRVVTDGGRVLCAVALGESVTLARDAAYAAVRKIAWDGVFFRSDIGFRAIERERRSAEG